MKPFFFSKFTENSIMLPPKKSNETFEQTSCVDLPNKSTNECTYTASHDNATSLDADGLRQQISCADLQLLRCFDIISEVHNQFFSLIDQGFRDTSTAVLLSQIRARILSGCSLVFSGIFPKEIAGSHLLWRHAEALGAYVGLEVTQQTTHLVTNSLETSKSKYCVSLNSMYVVHLDWLLFCIWNINREDEMKYLLAPPPRVSPVINQLLIETVVHDTSRKRKYNSGENEVDLIPGSLIDKSDIIISNCSNDDEESEWLSKLEAELDI